MVNIVRDSYFLNLRTQRKIDLDFDTPLQYLLDNIPGFKTSFMLMPKSMDEAMEI